MSFSRLKLQAVRGAFCAGIGATALLVANLAPSAAAAAGSSYPTASTLTIGSS